MEIPVLLLQVVKYILLGFLIQYKLNISLLFTLISEIKMDFLVIKGKLTQEQDIYFSQEIIMNLQILISKLNFY